MIRRSRPSRIGGLYRRAAALQDELGRREEAVTRRRADAKKG
jgi:hypothetical protein